MEERKMRRTKNRVPILYQNGTFLSKYIVLIMFGLIIITGSEAFGAVQSEHGNVVSSGAGTTWACAFKTIQEVVTAAIASDEIWVMEGTYNLVTQLQVNKDGVDSTQELYPFVFETIGDWDVTTSVTPPEGFESTINRLMRKSSTKWKRSNLQLPMWDHPGRRRR
jgi:hypothetical protein